MGEAPAGVVSEAPHNVIPEAALQEGDGPLLSPVGLPLKPHVRLHDGGPSLDLPVTWCPTPKTW